MRVVAAVHLYIYIYSFSYLFMSPYTYVRILCVYTRVNVYIYIYVCVCVCLGFRFPLSQSCGWHILKKNTKELTAANEALCLHLRGWGEASQESVAYTS